ncbi:sensor histidine kinase [Streptomyces sp. DSM 15324]|uniref:sensor histidine kinase n=1 Tax=Streptomyces sp. DSM 15324 TaxID=1739111 RepID=UPI000748EAF8|nr:sensor histidine kinase [Streptomyces sp. DSM 15324]KUO12774.1 histidine kinase [Streptomyces sp. DSM 15324]
MSTKEVDAPARSATSAPSSVRRGLRNFADRWPFQRKLNLLVGIPLGVIALMLAYFFTELVQESNQAEDAAQLVRDSTQVARLVSDLQNEHQQAILLSVRHQATFDGGTPSTNAYRKAQLAVDDQVRKVVDAFGDRLPDSEAQALRGIEGLAGLRTTIEQGYLPADNIDPAYSGASDAVIDGLGLDRDTNLASTFTGNLLDSLLRADAAHGAYETGVFSARTGDSNALIEYTGAVGSYELYTYQADRFGRFATAAQADELGGVEHNSAQASISQHFAELAVDPSALQAESQADIRKAFRAALASYPDYSAQAQARLRITTSLIDQIADRADDASVSAQWRAGLLLNLALVCFALWIAFSVLVRRSVVRPVLALTGAAQEVADVAGRELARVADDDAEETGSPRLRELPVTADDEIGELAEAFNNVQTTAAALLERQVLSRRNVAEMFGNVGRRVSNLTTRQLALIDWVERGETDPALLERLYSIDHIAVRLRRNADSLMLLAGIRETALASGPTELTNVVRAALGQIEGYRRVQLHARGEAVVEPDMVGDLTLMIAELLENAVSFSPEGSPVEVRVGSDQGGASITVSDHGLGMSAERLAEENARLVRRERLDLVPTKVLGLFVVGALARRWDVDVTLTRTPGGGVTAEVRIPATLLLTLSEVGAPTAAAQSLPAPSAPAAGPSPAAAASPTAQDATSLPRRVPRREQPSWAERDPEPATATATATASEGADQEAAARALPRRSAKASAPAPATDTATSNGTPASGGRTTTWASASADGGTASREPASAHDGRTTDPATASTPDSRTTDPATASAHDGRTTDPATSPPHDGRTTDRTTASTPDSRTTDPTAPTAASAHDGRAAAAAAAATGGPGPADASGAGSGGGPGGARVPVEDHARTPDPAGPAVPAAALGEVRPAAAEGARPLRRRVRGATLRTTVDASAAMARQAARPADADAVRSALEEFEAAVERAHRDTDGSHDRRVPDDHRNPPHHQNHLPEGAEQ